MVDSRTPFRYMYLLRRNLSVSLRYCLREGPEVVHIRVITKPTVKFAVWE